MQDTMKGVRPYGSMTVGLSLPTQAAPIDRSLAGIALVAGSGVEAAGWWDTVKNIAVGLGKAGDYWFG